MPSKKQRSRDPWHTMCKSVYVFQRYNWDCGLACAEMAMKWANLHTESGIKIDASPIPPVSHGDPLWNIEIYMKLKERGVHAEFSTSEKGVGVSNMNLDFYKNIFSGNAGTPRGDTALTPNDSNLSARDAILKRVNDEFLVAENRGWSVKDVIPTDDLMEQMSGDPAQNNCCALVLINWYILRGTSPTHSDFFGHCILVVGFDPINGDVKFLDPLVGSKVQSVKKDKFNAARMSPGTDMDLIVVRPTQQPA